MSRAHLLQTPLTIEQFARKVHVGSRDLEFGAKPFEIIDDLVFDWRSLDPTDVVRQGDQQPRLVAVLGNLAARMNESRIKKSQVPWLPVIRDQVILDANAIDLDNGVQEVALENIVEARERSGGWDIRLDSRFAALSARALLLHTTARNNQESRLEGWRKRSAELLVKASLGNLIKDSVSEISDLHSSSLAQQKHKKKASHLTGRITELMYFSYRMLEIYKNNSIAEEVTRFAIYREDHPIPVANETNKSFDAVNHKKGQVAELVQVKTAHSSDDYGEIKIWKPASSRATEDVEHIASLFSTVVDNEVSDYDVQRAWLRLKSLFGNPPVRVDR